MKALNSKLNKLEDELDNTTKINSEEIIGIRDAVNCMLDEVPQTTSIESRFNSIEDSLLEQVNSIPSIESRLYLPT